MYCGILRQNWQGVCEGRGCHAETLMQQPHPGALSIEEKRARNC
jgi:hypothetical protein